MSRYINIIIILLVTGKPLPSAPSPLRVTIDCGSEEQYANSRSAELLDRESRFDVNSFCEMIHRAVPAAVEGGRFVAAAADQAALGDAPAPRAVAPPPAFLPELALSKLKSPRLGVPKLKVPTLGAPRRGPPRPPSVGAAMAFPSLRELLEEETSAERMEKFKKGVQKMLHVVKVLGQVDRYLSERTRIVVEKLSKTFAD